MSLEGVNDGVHLQWRTIGIDNAPANLEYPAFAIFPALERLGQLGDGAAVVNLASKVTVDRGAAQEIARIHGACPIKGIVVALGIQGNTHRSEEHTSELQSLMRISYAVFCLKKKRTNT